MNTVEHLAQSDENADGVDGVSLQLVQTLTAVSYTHLTLPTNREV